MVSSSLKRCSTTSIAAAKMLNSNGDSTHPCRSLCVTSNYSESFPSFICTLAHIPSWNWRMTSIITNGTPARASTLHNSSRSTKHMYSEIFLCRSSSWNRQTTNSMSMVDRAGRKLSLLLRQYLLCFALVTKAIGDDLQQYSTGVGDE